MLMQKEWVAMGHPFCSRNKLTSSFKSDDETDTSQVRLVVPAQLFYHLL